MSAAWITIGGLAASTALIRAAGPLLLGGRELPARLAGVILLMPAALLSALIVVETFADGRELVLDERAIGLAAAGVAVALRAPVLVVVLVAAAATGVARAVT